MATTEQRKEAAIREAAAARLAGATWPTMAELRDDATSWIEEAARSLDELDVRFSAIVRNEGRPEASAENIAALATFIELAEMDLEVIKTGIGAAQSALHIAAVDSWVPKGGRGGAF
jgi:hypothetical protein